MFYNANPLDGFLKWQNISIRFSVGTYLHQSVIKLGPHTMHTTDYLSITIRATGYSKQHVIFLKGIELVCKSS